MKPLEVAWWALDVAERHELALDDRPELALAFAERGERELALRTIHDARTFLEATGPGVWADATIAMADALALHLATKRDARKRLRSLLRGSVFRVALYETRGDVPAANALARRLVPSPRFR